MFSDILKKRRTQYDISKNLDVSKEEIVNKIEEITSLVPDAFNSKSQRAVVLFDDKHDLLWDTIYDVFDGKVKREKIDSFKAAYGTILFFMT